MLMTHFKGMEGLQHRLLHYRKIHLKCFSFPRSDGVSKEGTHKATAPAVSSADSNKVLVFGSSLMFSTNIPKLKQVV